MNPVNDMKSFLSESILRKYVFRKSVKQKCCRGFLLKSIKAITEFDSSNCIDQKVSIHICNRKDYSKLVDDRLSFESFEAF